MTMTARLLQPNRRDEIEDEDVEENATRPDNVGGPTGKRPATRVGNGPVAPFSVLSKPPLKRIL